MATPVPVVSTMYFLVSIPPKTFIIVSPAFSAISVKSAMGEGSFAFGKAVGAGVTTALLTSRSRIAGKTETTFFSTTNFLNIGMTIDPRRRPTVVCAPVVLANAATRSHPADHLQPQAVDL